MLILCAIIGYLLGSVSCGIIFGWAFGKLDIRSAGSNSTGATNMLRVLGVVPSVLTFLGDMLKGVLAVLIGRGLAGETGGMLCALCAVVGHNWPVYYSFRGGKGIATSFGAILILDFPIAMILLAIQLVILMETRYMSAASIISSVTYVLLTYLFRGQGGLYLPFSAAIAVMAIYRHRRNIIRLINHNENQLDFSKLDIRKTWKKP